MELIPEIRARLLANGDKSASGADHDPAPVVKLVWIATGASWLLSELAPEDPDLAFGLCDLGLGYPELGWVRLSALAALRPPAYVDDGFQAVMTLSEYADVARSVGRIWT